MVEHTLAEHGGVVGVPGSVKQPQCLIDASLASQEQHQLPLVPRSLRQEGSIEFFGLLDKTFSHRFLCRLRESLCKHFEMPSHRADPHIAFLGLGLGSVDESLQQLKCLFRLVLRHQHPRAEINGVDVVGGNLFQTTEIRLGVGSLAVVHESGHVGYRVARFRVVESDQIPELDAGLCPVPRSQVHLGQRRSALPVWQTDPEPWSPTFEVRSCGESPRD